MVGELNVAQTGKRDDVGRIGGTKATVRTDELLSRKPAENSTGLATTSRCDGYDVEHGEYKIGVVECAGVFNLLRKLPGRWYGLYIIDLRSPDQVNDHEHLN